VMRVRSGGRLIGMPSVLTLYPLPFPGGERTENLAPLA
jgi:hypothetical protein